MKANLIITIKATEIKLTSCTAGPKGDRQMVKEY